MPIMTFYQLRPRGSTFTRVAVGELEHWPSDWIEVKLILSEIMAKLYREQEISAAVLLLERHMPGKKFIAFKSYMLSPFSFKRDFEGYFKVEYSHLSGEIWVPQAVFGFSLSFLTSGYLALEKGVNYRVQPLIPKMYQGIGSQTRHLLMEPSGLRYIDYARKPRSVYHDPDSPYGPHMLSYEREPRPVVEFQGRFEKVLAPREQ
jgi:hypothetical protein